MSEPTEHKPTPTMSQHALAVEALAVLIQTNGALPQPYIVMHQGRPNVLLQLDTPQGFEQWRIALAIAPCSVELHSYSGSVWLDASCTFQGVYVSVAGHGLPITAEQAASSPDTAQVLA